jgi:diaminopimelate decarboxylase
MNLSIPSDQLISFASRFGLPLFVYDAAVINRQIHTLRNAFDVPSLDIRYACKALSTIRILSHIYQAGCGIDTVSPGEIMMAMKAGVPPGKISFTPSGVLNEEYSFAIDQKVHIHVDQVHVLEWIDKNYPGTQVTLRFNPGIRAGGHVKLQVGSHDSKFGFLASQLDELTKLTDRMSLNVVGVHMHLGSDISDTGSFNQAYEYLLGVAAHWKHTLQHVDLGGGFKIPYHPDDPSIDILPFGNEVSHRFRKYCEEMGRELTLVVEPGKFVVSASGFLLMEVTGVRISGSTPMVYVQSGFNHFLRPMNYGAYHHIINISNPSGKVMEYDVVGYLCETDTFALQRPLNEVRKGDILCLMNAGAYGYTMASNYNGRPRPAEVLVEDGNPELIRRAETWEDVMRTDLFA